ncbi:MAG: hypothetical protein J1F67_06040 [Muribaculaceae bacterium]|nr:hypothetical protein [Muribaculaceae bacterium]
MKNILFYSIVHAMKIGSAICLLMALLAMILAEELFMPNHSWFINFLTLSGILLGLKFIFGGWSASSIKWMVISCIMSTIGAEIMIISQMVGEGKSFSFLICLIPIIIGVLGGIITYNWVNNVLDESTTSGITLDNVVDSVFDNGLKNTFWGIVDDYNANMFYAYSRGVAVYSNIVIFSGFITMICLMK